MSLETWVNELEPTGDLLLQIDIEGAEYRNIIAVPDHILARFRIIVIEVHRLQNMLRPAILRNVMTPFFEKFDAQYVCVHAHPNNVSKLFKIPDSDIEIPSTIEFTFLRRDRIDPAAATIMPMLPHPLDIEVNVKKRPRLFLGDAWLEGERPAESRREISERLRRYEQSSKSADGGRNRGKADVGLLRRFVRGLAKRFAALRRPSAKR